jgi:hypothetical protein
LTSRLSHPAALPVKRERARPDVARGADRRARSFSAARGASKGRSARLASGHLLSGWLFHGHGVAANEPWFVNVIEPNLAGATAIAEYWYELLNNPGA